MTVGAARSHLTRALRAHSFSLVVAVGGATLMLGCDRAPSNSGALAYPETRVVNVTDNYHGTIVADPYRWLEDLESSEVLTWAERQHQLARSQLQSPIRDWIYARVDRYGKVFDGVDDAMAQTAAQGGIRLVNDSTGTHKILTLRDPQGKSRTLVDGGTLGRSKDIARFTPSPDGRLVAYDIAEGGSEWVDTRIINVETGTVSPEVIQGLLFEEPEWTKDSKGFFYVKNERPREGSRVMLRAPSVRYHRVGTAQETDRVIFSTPDESTDLVLRAEVTGKGRYALIYEGTGAHMDGVGWSLTRVHVLDMHNPDTPDVAGALQPLSATRDAAYETIGSDESTLYLLTDNGAPRRRIVAVDLRNPAPEHWRTVVKESEAVIQSVREVDQRFVVQYLKDVQNYLGVSDRKGTFVATRKFPPMTSISTFSTPHNSEIRFTTSTFLRAPIVWRYNVARDALSREYEGITTFDTASFQTEQVWYPSKDGTRIPMFVVHRKGLAMDGSHPTLMYGYGSSGTVVAPEFSEAILAWLELGGVYAQPNIRGGGEFGRAWYDAAILGRKQTTFDDFIAAAEFLIAQKYTSPGKLGIRGASNGGLLVTAVMTQRPELFAAVVAEVPTTDNLRNDRGRHRARDGSPADSAQFEFLYAYSPLHRLKKATCYPATLTRTALNDDRAPAWMSLKFTASLQASQSCPHPALLLAYLNGGHLGTRGPTAWMEDAADALAFISQAVGVSVPAIKP